MSTYLDASVLVPCFIADPFTSRAIPFISRPEGELLMSDFASAETCSGIAKAWRKGALSREQVRAVFAAFDAWSEKRPSRTATLTADIARAEVLVRELDHKLRTPDAVHLAVAERTGAMLATFDKILAKAAVALGISLADI